MIYKAAGIALVGSLVAGILLRLNRKRVERLDQLQREARLRAERGPDVVDHGVRVLLADGRCRAGGVKIAPGK